MAQDFFEYLDSKGNLQKPKVKEIADEVDLPKDRENKPPKGEGTVGKQNPYIADGKSHKSSDKGLGDQGDSDLKVDSSKKSKPADLPTAEHTFLPKKVKDAILANPRMLEHLVNEFHKADLLGPLVAELSGYRETFDHLTEIMANENYGPSVCDRFARSLQESVTPGKFGSSRDQFVDDENIDTDDDEMPDELADFEGDDEIPDDEMMDDEMPFDEELPDDDELEPSMDGMPSDPKMGMPKALEHLNYSLNKKFI